MKRRGNREMENRRKLVVARMMGDARSYYRCTLGARESEAPRHSLEPIYLELKPFTINFHLHHTRTSANTPLQRSSLRLTSHGRTAIRSRTLLARTCAIPSRSRLTQPCVFQSARVCATRRKRWTCTSTSAVARPRSDRRCCSHPGTHHSSSRRRPCCDAAPTRNRRCRASGRMRTAVGRRLLLLLRICQRLLVQLGRERLEVLVHVHRSWRPFDAHRMQILGADWALGPV